VRRGAIFTVLSSAGLFCSDGPLAYGISLGTDIELVGIAFVPSRFAALWGITSCCSSVRRLGVLSWIVKNDGFSVLS